MYSPITPNQAHWTLPMDVGVNYPNGQLTPGSSIRKVASANLNT